MHYGIIFYAKETCDTASGAFHTGHVLSSVYTTFLLLFYGNMC